MITKAFLQYGYYGFLALGAVSMLGLTILRRKLYGLSMFSAIGFPIVLLVCGITGAKLLYYIESSFSSFQGMSFFGAVYLVMLVMPLVGFMYHLKPSQTWDLCAPCVASIIGFMRFGCFCAGCCGGILCTWGGNNFRWPTQLMEGFGDMLILGFLLSRERSLGRQGMLYPTFLIAYGAMRFVIEFLRDTPKTMAGLSEGQWLSLLGILIAIVWFSTAQKGRARNGSNT